MRTHLVKHGDDLAVVIDKPLLDLLGANAETAFEVTTDGQTLVLTPVRDPERRDAFRSALEQANDRFGEGLSRLAD